MNGNRCEVCDDTNATIHCQECRRRTCEECDEILHLVDANKSHHRIPLFPSRGGSQVNSRGGSFAPTRNVSPRGLRRQDDGPTGASSFQENGKPDNNNFGVQPPDGNSALGDYAQPKPPPQQPVQHTPQQPTDYMHTQMQQAQRSQPPPPPPVEQIQSNQYQPANSYAQPAYQPAQPQYRQPHQAYQGRSGYTTPSGGVGMGAGARSGYATPTSYQYPVPRSMTHSGAATPTYGQQGARVSGTVPYSQWPQNAPSMQQASRAPAYDQKPLLDQQPVNPQQQAYLQHVELIQQHKAVEAHQRLMAQRNDMARHSQHQQYPRQMTNTVTMQPAPMHRYTTSYLMSNHGSVVSSVAPSARNSPPMQPMQPRVAVPSLRAQESVRQYVPVEGPYARTSWASAPQPQHMLQPAYGGYSTPSMYSIASSVSRTPYNEPRSPPVYTHAMNIGSVPRTPYNEPRTPYNEPQVPQMQRAAVPQVQRSAAPQPARTAPDHGYHRPAQRAQLQQPQVSQPYQAPVQQPQQSPYGAPAQNYAAHQIPTQPSPQRSAPMPSNPTYSQYQGLADDNANNVANPATASWSNRYDPDEAEARVRNLIADTERMLAGLSGLSGTSSQKPSEGVSV